jgi:hypothetical protein
LARNRGWEAIPEQEVLEGAGRIDVVLRKGAISVACEVSVTTGRQWELGNVEKCMKAGFKQVVVVAEDGKRLARFRQAAHEHWGGLPPGGLHFLSSEGLVDHLDRLAAEAASRREESETGSKKSSIFLHPGRAKQAEIHRTLMEIASRAQQRRKKKKDGGSGGETMEADREKQ